MGKQTSHLPEGTLLSGRYRIVKFIGSGGFGCTYLADHLLFGTKVAIKEFFVSSLCNRDNTGVVSIGTESQTMIVEKLANKFLREARSLNKLSHPNIVRVSDVFEENGTNYYVMDYIEGRSLHSAMYYDGPLSEARMMNYMHQIMDALEYLHGRNMLHLDIKPDNIMVDAKDKAILIDFGVAKQYGDGSNDGASTVMGQTPGFAPLEQMSNNVKAFSAATDIYALGATMYALLTGVTPPTAPELASGVAELQPLPPYVSENVRRTLAAMMEIKNSERLQSIAQVRAMLAGQPIPESKGIGRFPTAKIGGDSAGAPPQSTIPLDSAAQGPQLPGMSDAIDFDRTSDNRGKKKGWLIGVLAVAAAVIVGLGVFAFLKIAGSSSDKGLEDDRITNVDTDEITQDQDTEGDEPSDVDEPLPADNQGQATAANQGQTAAANQGQAATGNQGQAATGNQGQAAANTGTASNAGQNNSGQGGGEAAVATPVIVTSGTPGPNGHSYVNMGNGMCWATCNIGASSPEDSGLYFAWGEVEPKQTYTKSNYSLTDATFNKISGTQYDAATHKWGPSWRTPTNQDWNSLLANCTWEAKPNGVLLTSNLNGATLFLPNAGHKQSKKQATSFYWSGDGSGTNASAIAVSNGSETLSNRASIGSFSRIYGLPIRPVYKE